MLHIQNFSVGINGKNILSEISLTIKPGEVHVIMGPNGSGKTSLAMSLMGHPNYKVKSQNAKFKINDENIVSLSPDDRARKGLFVSFQNPIEITGVSLLAFLRTAAKALRPDEKLPLSVFKKKVEDALIQVGLDGSFMQRSVNEGFSGGERKRAEIAQMLILVPAYAILDEIDSGLDIDSLKSVAKAITFATMKQKTGVLLITHYSRILHHMKPTKVHILKDGILKRSGTMNLVRLIEQKGYAEI